MARRSAVLDSPHLATIDQLLLARNRSIRDLAVEFGLTYDSLQRYAMKLRGREVPRSLPARIPEVVFETARETFLAAFEVEPQPWQDTYIAETRNLALVKGRQIGASTAASALAIHTAMAKRGALAVIVSPSMKQSTEIAMKSRLGLWAIGSRLVQDSVSLIRLENGSRILSLAGTARAVRGYAADLLVVDEAAFVEDATWDAARATTAAVGGRTIVQSTPGHPAGWFHELATGDADWARMTVKSSEATTISAEFLERERAEMAPTLYQQEYEAEFGGTTSIGALWTRDEWAALQRPEEE